MKIDTAKKYRTRDGQVASGLTMTGSESFPISGYLGGTLATWTIDGKYYSWEDSDHDLIEEIPSDEPAPRAKIDPDLFTFSTVYINKKTGVQFAIVARSIPDLEAAWKVFEGFAINKTRIQRVKLSKWEDAK